MAIADLPTSHPLQTLGNKLRDFLSAFTNPSKHLWVCVVILLGLSYFLFFHGLTSGDLLRTESLRAIIGAEFLRSGNWIVPRLYGEPLFTKPPGMYALIAACSLPFGEVTEFSSRLPSAIAATLTVFLTFWYFGRQLGRLGGFLAAVILPLSPLWLEKATSAEIDMVQVAWTTASILFCLRALDDSQGEKNERDAKPLPDKTVTENETNTSYQVGVEKPQPITKPHRWPTTMWWCLSLLCVTGGLLSKWTTPAFFYLTMIPLLWWRRQLRLLWCRGHLLGVALAAAIFTGWAAAAVAMEGWDVWYTTIEREAMQRLMPGYTPFPYPWHDSLIHPLKLLVVTLPFSAIALLTLRPSFYQLWDDRGRRLLQALHCWTWVNMIFWSFPTEHAPRHSFPLFPGISGLASMVVFAWMTGKLGWVWPLWKPQHGLMATVFLWVVLKLVYVHAVIPRKSAEASPQVKGEVLAQLVPVDTILYIIGVKDEGIMFYYRQLVYRVSSPTKLPKGHPSYCVLLPKELEKVRAQRPIEVIRELTDQQGDPMILVRVKG
ncbi:MAG: ArnT family glycosyltransferase [Gemmataceae bacterium]